jgi:hypothetical protein
MNKNNKDRCEEVMERYLALDKDERIPFSITMHLLSCKKCRSQVRLMTIAEKTAAEPLKISVPLDDSTITEVIKVINDKYQIKPVENPISIHNWILGGILMILLMTVFGVFTNNNTSRELVISFYLLFGAIITAYCAIFIASNMDFFIKKIHTLKTSL